MEIGNYLSPKGVSIDLYVGFMIVIKGAASVYLSKIAIKNFRVFGEAGIEAIFNKGVNAIIGENNNGKSALIDALRIAFSTVPYKKDIFFNKSDFHINAKGEIAQTAQFDLYLEAVPNYLIEIWDPEHPTQGEFHIKFYKTRTPDGGEKVKSTAWGGKSEGNPLSPDTFDAIEIAFLGALRDAENEMKPSRTSKLANLLTSISNSEEMRNDLVSHLANAHDEILKKEQIQKTKEIINSNLLAIEEEILRQEIDIGLVEPRFESIAASLRAWFKPRWLYISQENPLYEAVLKKCEDFSCPEFIQRDENGLYIDTSGFIQKIRETDQELRSQLIKQNNHTFQLYHVYFGQTDNRYRSKLTGHVGPN